MVETVRGAMTRLQKSRIAPFNVINIITIFIIKSLQTKASNSKNDKLVILR